MNEKIVKGAKDAEKLLKEKTKLEKVLDTRETLETQNEILRHLEGLLVDGSQVPRLTTKSMTLTHQFTYPGDCSDGHIAPDGSKENLLNSDYQDITSLSVSRKLWEKQNNLKSGEF